MRRGSSPRVWGQVFGHCRGECSRRIIPTRVGTRTRRTIPKREGQDHPHACGDKPTLCCHIQMSPGSSPRVWGQVKKTYTVYSGLGIIPTRVGTRIYPNENVMTCEDHPHACGDKLLFCQDTDEVLGSSPRVWGQVASVLALQKLLRIIPTRVGTRIPRS